MVMPANVMGGATQPLPAGLAGLSVEEYLAREQQASARLPENTYWAAKEANEVVSMLKQKRRAFKRAAEDMGFATMWRLAYQQYFGRDEYGWTQLIQRDGEVGELLRFRVNETRSYLKQMVTMAIGNRPAFECDATNTDYDALSQAEMADNIVNYVYRTSYGERKERRAVEYAQAFGRGSTWIRWDPNAGEDVFEDQPVLVDMPDGSKAPRLDRVTGEPVTKRVATGKRTGELVIKAIAPWNQFHETQIDDEDDHVWRAVVERRSKHELAALSPDKADQILGVSSTDPDGFEDHYFRRGLYRETSDDSVPVIHFYHAASDALKPHLDRMKRKGYGRYLVCVGDVVLVDTVMPTRQMPIVDLMPEPFIGTSFGYASSWDMIAINQMHDQVISDIASNLSTFGRTSIYTEEGTTITAEQIVNGMKVLVGKMNSKPPTPINFAAIPEAAKWFVDTLRRYYQSISGLNATARGETDANVTSGTMAALFHSIAIEHASDSIAAVDTHRERVANLILDILKVSADHPMIVKIAGQDERANAQSFKKDDIYGIRGVTLRTANPMTRTNAGKMEIAQLQMKVPGAVTDPAQIDELLVSGQIKPLYEGPRKRRLGIRWEDEALSKGPEVQEVPAVPGALLGNGLKMPDTPAYKRVPTVPVGQLDNHQLHIDSHYALLCNPSVHAHPEIVAAILAHIDEHWKIWAETDPVRLKAANLPPWPGPPPAYTQPPQMPHMGAPPMPPPPPNGPHGAPPGAPQPPRPGPQSPPNGKPQPAPAAMQPTNQPKQMMGDMGVPLPKPAQSPIEPQAKS